MVFYCYIYAVQSVYGIHKFKDFAGIEAKASVFVVYGWKKARKISIVLHVCIETFSKHSFIFKWRMFHSEISFLNKIVESNKQKIKRHSTKHNLKKHQQWTKILKRIFRS